MLIRLIYNFFVVGLLSFGGAYSAIPITREIILRENFITLEEFSDMVAVAESTPGSFICNLATYIGSVNAGLLGAILTTIASVLPAFLIMILFSFYAKNIMKNENVKFVFSVIRPAIISLILVVGLDMMLYNLDINIVLLYFPEILPIKKLAIILLIILTSFIYKKIKKKNLSAIYLIIISAILGVILF